MDRSSTIESFKEVVARRLELAPETLYGTPLKLSVVIARSPQATKSIDLMKRSPADGGARARRSPRASGDDAGKHDGDVIEEVRVQLANNVSATA